MRTFVNKRSELTAQKKANETLGMDVYRTRLECDCPSPRNWRYGILVVEHTRHEVIQKVIRCKTCTAIQGGAAW